MPELAIALECTVTYLLGMTADPQRWVPDDGSLPIAFLSPRAEARSESSGGWHHGVWHPDGARSHDGDRATHTALAGTPRADVRRFTGRGQQVDEQLPARPTRARRA
jgi:hypothetical protein